MPDPAEQLQKLYLAGFELQTFDRFPKAIGVLRDGCIALLVPGADGLQILGNVGWRMGESLGPLVERGGHKVFVHKDQIIEATSERIATLDKFKDESQERVPDLQGRSRCTTILARIGGAGSMKTSCHLPFRRTS